MKEENIEEKKDDQDLKTSSVKEYL